jgi:hypothetical protein
VSGRVPLPAGLSVVLGAVKGPLGGAELVLSGIEHAFIAPRASVSASSAAVCLRRSSASCRIALWRSRARLPLNDHRKRRKSGRSLGVHEISI